jgi:hypothetical protein
MNTIEDRLFAAARAIAATVTADSVPPLDLSGVASRPNGKPPRHRRAFAVLAPLAAATAVVAVIAAVVVFSGGTHPQRPAPASSRVSLNSVPRYYMALVETAPMSRYDEAIVRDTLTGATLTTVHVPKPFLAFDSVTAAANDRSFVLSASIGPLMDQYKPTGLFLARFNPHTRAVALTKLPIPAIPNTEFLNGMALSPSGTELAISVQTGKSKLLNLARVSVYSLATGAVRSWRAYGGSIGITEYDSVSISWSRSGELAFNWSSNSPDLRLAAEEYGVYLLDLAKAGHSLSTDSRHVVRWPSAGLDPSWDSVATPDGKEIVAPVFRNGGDICAFEEFSAPRGRLLRILDKTDCSEPFNSVVWTNSTGSVLVVVGPSDRGLRLVLGVLSGSRFIPIPGKPVGEIQNPSLAPLPWAIAF